VDVLARPDGGEPVERPLEALDALPDDHPYRVVGRPALIDGIARFTAFTKAAGLAHAGDLEVNRRQVTTLGTLRPTCLLPEPAAGELRGEVAVIDFAGFRDFSAALCVQGLRRAGHAARPERVELPPWRHQRYFTAVELARAIDNPTFRAQLAPRLIIAGAGSDTLIVPAVLGQYSRHEAWADLEQRTGKRLVEAALPPPSVPGMRLFDAWRARLRALGVAWQFGFPAVGLERSGDRVTAVRSDGASRPVVTRCRELVLATGGVAGHGIEARRDGSLAEVVAGLPVDGFAGRMAFLADRFLGAHPLAAAGVRVDAELRPLAADGGPVHPRLFAAGAVIGGHEAAADGTGLGTAILTGYLAGRAAARD
jgi:glycerol-3-phosphate dehydrogenase subunit B